MPTGEELRDSAHGRSPAREAACMGQVAQVRIGDVEVLAVKSELHLATDGVSRRSSSCGSR